MVVEHTAVEECTAVEGCTAVEEYIEVEKRIVADYHIVGERFVFDYLAVEVAALLGCTVEDCSGYLAKWFPLEPPIVTFQWIRQHKTILKIKKPSTIYC